MIPAMMIRRIAVARCTSLVAGVLGLLGLAAACAEQVDLDKDQPEVEQAATSEKPTHQELLDYGDGHEPVSLAQEPPATVDEIEGLEVRTVETPDDADARALRYGEVVKLNIIGRLADGREFKNTWATEPETVRIFEGGLPKGLAVALDGIKIGERRTVRVPPSAAYGDSGDPFQQIPKQAILFYDVRAEDVVEGLVCHQMKAGDGDQLLYGDTAKFHYTGILARNGREFDSSRGKGEPFSAALQKGSLIDGWTLGLQGMKVGEQRRLFIPSELAYGERGQGDSIGPDQDLIFEVELVEVTKPDASGSGG